MFYTYLWLREDGTPYYVGKGSGNRAFTNWAHGVHKPTEKERILVQEVGDEKEAFEAEVFLISYFGRLDLGTGCLRNLTDGGENPPSNKGKHHTEMHRRRLSESQKGVKGHWFGRKASEETKALLSKQRRGKKQSPEHVAKRIASRLKTLYGYKGEQVCKGRILN